MKCKLAVDKNYTRPMRDRQWGLWNLYYGSNFDNNSFLYGHKHKVWESMARLVNGANLHDVIAQHRKEY